MSIPRVSLIVPAYNEERWFGRLAEALGRQGDPPDEVVIADGMSSDDTVSIARTQGFQVVTNPLRHAAGGRNAGLTVVSGDIVAFTDCDCVPAPDWIGRIRQRFQQEPNLVALGGRMSALPPMNEIERFAAHVFIDQIMRFPSECTRPVPSTNVHGAFITANVAYRRRALDELGGFTDWFSNHAEDIDLYWRALARYSGKLLYDPNLVVEHSFPTTLRGLWRKHVQYGVASSKLSKRHSRNRVQVDWQLYQRLLASCFAAVTNRNIEPNPGLQALQLAAHATGKLLGSITSRCVNL